MMNFTDKNRRRIALIEKKYDEGLSSAEIRELDQLKVEIYGYMKIIDPRSTDLLDEIEARIRVLEKYSLPEGAP
jgi:hypothetical protein